MDEDRLLIVFVKNPRKGSVKTRLAETVGSSRALEIYRRLIEITSQIAEEVKADRQVWYSGTIETDDNFEPHLFSKRLQMGRDLGERMHHAVKEGLRSGFKKVILIGSDCPDITPELIHKGFDDLETSDVIIGPSRDGGYYLIGFSRYDPHIFDGIRWSTPAVFQQTLERTEKIKLSMKQLEMLNDIDTEEDLMQSRLKGEFE
jgi:rSAM/selenodomain-associated transferase 1